MKNVYTLVDDIYKLVKTKKVDKDVDIDQCIDDFGESVKELMRKEFGQRRAWDGRKLRMSNIGKRDRFYGTTTTMFRSQKKCKDIRLLSSCTDT